MEFRVLGRLEVVDDGRDVAPRRRKRRALLTLLLLRAGDVVSLDDVLDALWGTRPPSAARNAVHGHIAELRKLLGHDRIETRETGYALRLEEDELDLHRFERLVIDARGRPAAKQAEMLGCALDLFRGPPLDEFRYESFADAEAARIDELRLLALEERIDADLALGRHGDLVPELERLVRDAPLRERLRGQLMLALYRSGRQAEALAVYQRMRATLLAELGIEPGPGLRRLERQILNQDHAVAAPSRVAAAARIPVAPTPLLGRERELADALELLLREDVRLLTLVGPGGIGKTRLALELARTAAPRFREGTFFVSLASVAGRTLVIPTVLRALGLDEVSAQAEDGLGARLAGRSMLVLVDNFEHVVDTAPALARLLWSADALKLLVTSREPLHLYGEHLYRVPPLDDEAATSLFRDRAGAVGAVVDRHRAALAVIREICHRLDRLPLAIELAAARTDMLSIDELLRRLDDRLQLLTDGPVDQPPRLQTLRQTLEWSYRLLTSDEQRLFSRLAVFVGGWTVDAVDAICADGGDVVQRLSRLTDKNLVQLASAEQEPRQEMLETIREYAAQLLEQSQDAGELERRHIEYYLALAEQAEPHLRANPGAWLDRLELEDGNIHRALERLEERGDAEFLQRLAGALWRFWYLRGRLSEGRRYLERARAADQRPTPSRVKVLLGAAVMAVNTEDYVTATARAEEALALCKLLGDAWGAAYATFMLGNLAVDRGHACRLYEESARAFRDLGDEHTALLATRHLAFARSELGEPDRARVLHEENLARARATGNKRMEASSLGALAEHAITEGRVDEAVAHLRDSLRLHRDVGDVLDTAVDLCRFAAAIASAGDAATALRLVASFEAVADEVGGRRSALRELNEQTLASIRAQIEDATFSAVWSEGLELHLDEAVDLALDAVA